ncbi:hypothetical protein NCAS_0D04590 [Naumovozyma castellii]|uniref:Large ribosomal subunit protein mL49 n=1 Tax=Naumovozyma castellii TaxID=27288 RepID=G0VEP9_NAUCA|nr:hypothetical protein NCAS_0D04590 [Naumovozyma castellii CBS 4309]CCC70040.1 hypothetical protein NCAS_0D04590 [Naumovozyma castellii CBS 4309]
MLQLRIQRPLLKKSACSLMGMRTHRYHSTVIEQSSTVLPEATEASGKNSEIIFPRLTDIKASDLIGGSSFGSGNYFITRSSTGNLPVYSDYKAGGNKHVTEIRRIQGDIIQLRNDLQKKLPKIPLDNWKVLPQSKKIIIKGNVVMEIKQILSSSF